MTMGERIEKLRLEHDMTLEELGAHLGVKKGAIYKYQVGEVENIPRSSVVKMAALFNVTPEYILAFSDDEKMGYMSDSMIREYLTKQYGEETVRFFEKFSSMTEENRTKLFGLCQVIEKAEKYDRMLALTKE